MYSQFLTLILNSREMEPQICISLNEISVLTKGISGLVLSVIPRTPYLAGHYPKDS